MERIKGDRDIDEVYTSCRDSEEEGAGKSRDFTCLIGRRVDGYAGVPVSPYPKKEVKDVDNNVDKIKSNTPPQAEHSPIDEAKCLDLIEGRALVRMSAVISPVGQ